MTINKKFLEAASKDSALQAEVEHAVLEALGDFMKAKGLEEEAAKIREAAAEKVAEAHGFTSDEMEELSDDELEAVAGGVCLCPAVGGGTGYGKQCFCFIGGKGTNADTGRQCGCAVIGMGLDD